MLLINGQCKFTRLRFKTTTFNESGSFFHLVVIVFVNDGETKEHFSKYKDPSDGTKFKILASKVSTVFGVISRKINDDSV